jgi:hypothetical protein
MRKRVVRVTSNQLPAASHQRRRGALFNYIMVYVTVGSILLTTAGVCLHSVLRSDNSDRQVALFLSSLKRAEHQLREDSRDQPFQIASPTELSASTSTGRTLHWSALRGILSRTVMELEQQVASDRFVFPAGSVIEMSEGPDASVVVRITEPSAFVKYSTMGNGGSNLNKPAEEAVPAVPSFVAQPKWTEIRLRGIKR